MSFPLSDYFFNLENFEYKQVFTNIVYPWEALLHLKDDLNNYLKGKSKILVGSGVIIDKAARIEGPAIIGDNTVIGYQAYLRGPIMIGKNCHIGRSEIKNSILLDDVSAAHFNYIGDSIVGNRVNIGAGVKLSNLRLDCEPITISYGNKKIKTSMEKLGAIIGDGCKIGSNAVLNPGVILGKNCFIYPLINVRSQFYQSNTKINK